VPNTDVALGTAVVDLCDKSLRIGGGRGTGTEAISWSEADTSRQTAAAWEICH
jgi:hypothetical protein